MKFPVTSAGRIALAVLIANEVRGIAVVISTFPLWRHLI